MSVYGLGFRGLLIRVKPSETSRPSGNGALPDGQGGHEAAWMHAGHKQIHILQILTVSCGRYLFYLNNFEFPALLMDIPRG